MSEVRITAKHATATCTIASGASNSDTVDIRSYRLARILTPSSIGGLSTITPKAVDSSGNVRTLYDSEGSAMAAISIAANTYYTLPAEAVAPGHRLALTGNTTASADVAFTIELVG